MLKEHFRLLFFFNINRIWLQVKNVDLWSYLPFSNDTKISDVEEEEEEEEIPTRISLKREAQFIYETRSRRKGYRPLHGKQF